MLYFCVEVPASMSSVSCGLTLSRADRVPWMGFGIHYYVVLEDFSDEPFPWPSRISLSTSRNRGWILWQVWVDTGSACESRRLLQPRCFRQWSVRCWGARRRTIRNPLRTYCFSRGKWRMNGHSLTQCPRHARGLWSTTSKGAQHNARDDNGISGEPAREGCVGRAEMKTIAGFAEVNALHVELTNSLVSRCDFDAREQQLPSSISRFSHQNAYK